ncbi:MAG TPA: DUF1553 domain-containing protein [Bryobacteraceae bacterium]
MRFFLLTIVLSLANAPASLAEQPTVEFNRDIRPIFSDKCFTCHGPDATNRKTKMRLDIESGAKVEVRGGHRSIVAGDPDASEIYRRISSDNKAVRMPPAYLGREKLTAREISLIRDWIAQGAKWEPFWSFIPPKRPPLPAVKDPAWVRNPIDNFILSRLEREGLHPSPEADQRTLIRRVTLDLTGIPPTPAEIDAFLADSSTNAYEKVVDRLLASPRYAERMAFRWMEAARYGDTNGYQTDGPREMWRWRDWVLDAFNRNMPYDEFTVDQLAGDLLPNATLSQKIATGFNRNHRTNGEGGIIPEEYRVEYVADRAQTTATVWMGLTLGCARCHDHKYDPFLQKDFYRLFAYFNNIPNEKGFSYNYGNEEPYIKAPLPEQQKQLAELDQAVATAEAHYAALHGRLEKEQAHWEKHLRHSSPDWTVTEGLQFRSAADLPVFDGKHSVDTPGDKKVAYFGYLDPFTFSVSINPNSPNGGIVSRSEDYFEGMGQGLYLINGKLRVHIIHRWTDLGIRLETKAPVKLHEWQNVVVTYDGKRKASGIHVYIDGIDQPVDVLFDQLNEPFHVNEKIPIRIGAAGGKFFEGSIRDFRIYGRALTPQEAAAVSVPQTLSEIAALAKPARTDQQLQKMELAFLDTAASLALKTARAHVLDAHTERDRFYDSIPTVMVMEESPTPRDSFLLVRGAYDKHGERVTPGVPAVLPQPPAGTPDNRLGLARWIVDRANPLTARVAVNRYWQSYFGFGIVKTVDDFGSQGEWPSHPELLDWLAVEFMDSGWNVKAMQRTIVTSATYRQSSKITPELLKRDPDNRLLARGPRFRLGPEVIRDSALAASGLLVEKVGGPSVKPYQPPGLWQELGGGDGYKQDKGPALYRRSLYTYWKRTVTPPFMANFDSPNREVCTVYENRTNTPLQALDLMNDVTFLEASRKLAERMMEQGGTSPESRIDYGFELLLARAPRDAEGKVLLDSFNAFDAKYRADPKAAEEYLSYGEAERNKNLNTADLAAYATVASLIFNLDEAVTKE